MSYGDDVYGGGSYGGSFGAITLSPDIYIPPIVPDLARARIVYENLALSSTIAASSQLIDRPASYLKSAARWKKWRSATSVASQSVTFTFASSVVQSVVLVDWLAHPGGAINAEYWDGGGWAFLGAFDLPAFNPTKVTALWHDDGVITTKIRLTFANTLAANAHVELGVAMIGPYFQPSYSIVDGFEIILVDPSAKVRSLDGQLQAQVRTPFHVARGVFEHLPSTDRTSFAMFGAAVGMARPFFFALHPYDVDQQLYCSLAEPLAYQQIHQDFWSIPMSVEEER